MKIYEFEGFPNPARIRIALAEKGLTDHVEFISVDVPNDGQIRRVSDPQVTTMPSQTLNRVEALREDFRRLSLAIAVRVEDHDDTITWSLWLWLAILRSHADKEAAALVKRHRARLSYYRLARE